MFYLKAEVVEEVEEVEAVVLVVRERKYLFLQSQGVLKVNVLHLELTVIHFVMTITKANHQNLKIVLLNARFNTDKNKEVIGLLSELLAHSLF